MQRGLLTLFLRVSFHSHSRIQSKRIVAKYTPPSPILPGLRGSGFRAHRVWGFWVDLGSGIWASGFQGRLDGVGFRLSASGFIRSDLGSETRELCYPPRKEVQSLKQV